MEKHSVRSYGTVLSGSKGRVILPCCCATGPLQASEVYEIQVNSPSFTTDKHRLW